MTDTHKWPRNVDLFTLYILLKAVQYYIDLLEAITLMIDYVWFPYQPMVSPESSDSLTVFSDYLFLQTPQ